MPKRVETPEDKAEKKAYIERKKKLFKFEKTNYDRIIFLRGTKGYWLVGGHSAVILANKIAKEVKLRIALKRDTDFDIKFKEGVVNFRNAGFYKEKLDNSVYLERGKETDEYFSYKLKEKISEEEFDLLVRSKEIRRQKLETMIQKSDPLPKLNRKLTDILKIGYKNYIKRTDTIHRKFFVENFIEDLRIAHKTMLLTSRMEIEKKEGLKKVNTALEYALLDLYQIMELEIWGIEDCTLLSVMIVEAKVESGA